MTEAELEKKIADYAKSCGMLCYKWSSPSHRGVPDRIIIGNGHVLFLEIKRAGGRPSPLQEKVLERIRAQGCMASWVDNLADAQRYIDSLL